MFTLFLFCAPVLQSTGSDNKLEASMLGLLFREMWGGRMRAGIEIFTSCMWVWNISAKFHGSPLNAGHLVSTSYRVRWSCGVPADCERTRRPRGACPSGPSPPPRPPRTWSSGPSPSTAFPGSCPWSARSAPRTPEVGGWDGWRSQSRGKKTNVPVN